ncbi:hypothetical protein [Campylobacter concisus]|uniref:Transcriptional regulator n=1 Tax=Campylobacter concisus TaxID=199 RepID=A0A7S9RRD2_9BACT|nr:hypothetical protein [Campylobacter concisus]QPH96536.1 hypothetical protein CVT08_04415 [Campylobacter concisus]
MTESHVISALVSKHSELQGNIKYYQDIISKLKSELETIDRAITIFDPSYKTTFIRAKRISNASYFPHGELNRRIIECLKIKPSTVNEIAEYVFKDEEVDDTLIAKYRQNISSLISKLIKRGTVSLFTDNGVKFYKIAS